MRTKLRSISGAVAALTVAVIVTASSCRAAWLPIAYDPRPMQSAQAAETLERLLMSGRMWNPARVEIKPSFLMLQYVGQYGVTNSTLSFAEIAKVELLNAASWKEFDVEVRNKSGESIFRYYARNQEQAQEFIDALASLSKAISEGATNPESPGRSL